ncbi:hypothetical protein EMPS_09114 [Entomortierella parvispora]|uniref:F-box domain-containing protein n=1 Tax=Entomortierella parvispora TaxID=205924 RepID=A0A9P3HHE8_9FUNG|nr:hypothetical protein EMPS_09114 [Entomortierella parvispora]
MPRALDIPEIRVQIGPYLRCSALAKCALVSRAWYATFAPQLWRDSHLEWDKNDKPDNPGLQLIRKNSPSICVLNVKLSYGPILPLLHFPFVRDLTVRLPSQHLYLSHYEDADQDPSPRGDQDIADFLIRHQPSNGGRVSKLQIDFGLHGESTTLLWPTITCWRNLTLCEIKNGRVRRQDWDMCWEMWSGIETLYLDFVQFEEDVHLSSDEPGEGGPPVRVYPSKTKSLRLQTIGLHYLDQIRWIELCPDLEQLDWRLPHDETSNYAVLELEECLKNGACPRLTRLILDSPKPHCFSLESTLPGLLQTAQPLEVLSLEGRELGMPFWQSLSAMQWQRHFATLRELTVNESGVIVQRMLCSLPSLQTFQAKMLSFSDILDYRHPWLCKDLKTLTLFFVLDTKPPTSWFASAFKNGHLPSDFPSLLDQQDQIFDRLAELTQLQTLDIGCRSWEVYDPPTLDFRVSLGLKKLGALKQLTALKFLHTKQDLQEEDVQWMLSHWPCLDYKLGSSSRDRAMEERLNSMFRQAGVVSRACK